jgi:UDP-sugar transporter A1/2/3
MAKAGTLKKVYNEWTLVGALTASGFPAAIYALQNSLLQISYKNLDSLTFSMLNQTKIIFTALFTYFIMRYVLQWHLFNSCCFSRYGISVN